MYVNLLCRRRNLDWRSMLQRWRRSWRRWQLPLGPSLPAPSSPSSSSSLPLSSPSSPSCPSCSELGASSCPPWVYLLKYICDIDWNWASSFFGSLGPLWMSTCTTSLTTLYFARRFSGFLRWKDAKDADNYRKRIDESMVQFWIAGKVHNYTTDNEATMQKAFDGDNWNGCFADIETKSCQVVLKKQEHFKQLLKKLKKIAKKANTSNKFKYALEEEQKKRKLKVLVLKQELRKSRRGTQHRRPWPSPSCTWATTARMLMQCFHKGPQLRTWSACGPFHSKVSFSPLSISLFIGYWVSCRRCDEILNSELGPENAFPTFT